MTMQPIPQLNSQVTCGRHTHHRDCYNDYWWKMRSPGFFQEKGGLRLLNPCRKLYGRCGDDARNMLSKRIQVAVFNGSTRLLHFSCRYPRPIPFPLDTQRRL